MMASAKEGDAMLKKYIVRLTDEERKTLQEIVGKLGLARTLGTFGRTAGR
jgi:hypothetical protein